MVDRCLSCLGRISETPKPTVQAPRDLDCWREGRLKRHARQSDSTDESCNTRRFNGPFAEACCGEMLFRSPNVGVALLPREHTRQKPHDNRISVLLGEC